MKKLFTRLATAVSIVSLSMVTFLSHVPQALSSDNKVEKKDKLEKDNCGSGERN